MISFIIGAFTQCLNVVMIGLNIMSSTKLTLLYKTEYCQYIISYDNITNSVDFDCSIYGSLPKGFFLCCDKHHPYPMDDSFFLYPHSYSPHADLSVGYNYIENDFIYRK